MEDEGAAAELRHGGGEVDGGADLAAAAVLVGDADDSHGPGDGWRGGKGGLLRLVTWAAYRCRQVVAAPVSELVVGRDHATAV